MISAIYAIKSNLPNFTKKERQVADYILMHPQDSVNPSIEELARNIGISQTTLVRFVKKLGFPGYQAFRIALAKESTTDSQQLFEIEITGKQSVSNLVFNHTIKILEETYKLIDPQAIKKVAQRIAQSKSVFLFGLGGSNIAARDAFHKFIRSGIPCQFAEDFHMQLMLASQAGTDDVGLVFSHTGSNYDILSLSEELKSHGCYIIAFTSYPSSPLAKMADISFTDSLFHSNIVAEAFTSNIAYSTIVNILYVEIMQILGKRGMNNLNKMREAIAKRKS
ncbi:MAG: MurR/RpiR family transcriptional regulator [Spirochaetia bacterium]|jgi:DNA-binding MurR/RpiR family transcriptional regulator|nr:MurR/RpiR family transcriptional regulator [Spirochaetia bacterium]